MRNAYCRALRRLMSADDRIYALTADIGFRNFDRIIADFPDRFINAGVAEADMTGIAAGLALSGKIPFTFTIAPFVTMRCLEQIRLDLCYHNLPVKIVGAGGGFVYGPQGTTHHALEEIGILRTLPNMTIICPADPVQTEKAVTASMALDGPAYIRIGRNNEPNVTPIESDFRIGKADTLREGNDLTIIASGTAVESALKAAEILAGSGTETRVVNMHTVKPLDREAVIRAAEETGGVITVEEHSVIGGLGSAVAEVLAEGMTRPVLFKRVGIRDTFIYVHAHYEELRRIYGLDGPGIAGAAEKLVMEKKPAAVEMPEIV